MKINAARRDILQGLVFENPPPEERWFQRDDWDPMYKLTDLRAAARAGHIELAEDAEPECYQIRLTAKGRAALDKAEAAQ
ncbi:hypothetical protein [Aureimonas glaciei]|uniref:Uncharacterized protein n=1 Tax=Aureimonas glaciei TaxID=1776957 RepID=A0A916Y4S6_9HYPH|nr:hypothetical protein [Aureimonas glaciei]GGD30944.1 hypothetical protein GCM10011335_37490 [Aureimonas glaciei]